jgi:hypothetical protein
MALPDEFYAVIQLRVGGKFVPRSDVLRWNGRLVRVMLEDEIEPGESSLYVGEFRCRVLDDEFPRWWIASGDLRLVA